MKTTILALFLSILSLSVVAQESLVLPPPHTSGGMPLMEALAKRATVRSFDTVSLTRQQLSDLLWAAFGVNRPDGKRTAPSARNFQETDIYVLLKEGAFVYNARENKLRQVLKEDIRELGGTQPFVKDAPVILVFIADLSKMGEGKAEDKINTAYIDVGYISQNVYLFCTSEGLATGARMSIDREALAKKLGLREDQRIILAHCVGYQKNNSRRGLLIQSVNQYTTYSKIPWRRIFFLGEII